MLCCAWYSANPLNCIAAAAMIQKEYVGSRASDASSRLSSASTVRGSDAASLGFATGGSLLSSARCGFQTASRAHCR